MTRDQKIRGRIPMAVLLAFLGLTGTVSVHGCTAGPDDDEAEDLGVAEQAVVSGVSAMAVERTLATATLLNNGRVLVVGGKNGAAVHCSAEVFDPVQQLWTATGAMSQPAGTLCSRFQHTATLLGNGKVLVAGGNNGQGINKITDLYDPATGAWTSAASMGSFRYVHTATLLNDGKVLVTGGYGAGWHASTEVYDPSLNTWAYKASMSTARSAHTATRLADGKVLVIGGHDGSVNLASVELYNPADNTWAAKAPLATARRGHSAALLPAGKILVVGGVDAAGSPAPPELYNPATNQWTSGGAMITARTGASVDLVNGKIVVAGGVSAGALLNSIEVHDPASNTWSAAAPMASARAFQASAMMPSGRLLLAGGHKTMAGDARKEVEVHRTSIVDKDLGSLLGANLPIDPASTCFTQNDSAPTCVSSPAAGQDVLLTWKALCADTFTFETEGSSGDTVLSVLDPVTLAPIGGSNVGCNDDDPGGGLDSEVKVGLPANQQVLIVIDSYNAAPSCGNVKLSISRALPSGPEVCDGKDNDCNGSIDEGNPGGGVSCNTGNLGVCSAGITQCVGGQIQCIQLQQASSEICDAKDNDCDGQSDEGNPGGGGSCWTGLPGVCADAIWTCEAGAYHCKPKIPQGSEVCDGLDNDCDGQTDEGNPPGVACTTGAPGVCATGLTSCATGVKVCQQTVSPAPEVCDGLDNDCNGTVDYFTECWYRCSGGSNSGQTCDGDFDCPAGVCKKNLKYCNGGPNNGATCTTAATCLPCSGDESPCVGPACATSGSEDR